MEHLEALLHSASYLGVIDQLMRMSTTDIAVLFLISKPAFILTAGVVVLTTGKEQHPPGLPEAENDATAGYLPEDE